jgi:hypothetical protein
MLSCHHGPGGRAADARRIAALWPVLGSAPARAAVGTAGLLPGETLLAGQSISTGRDILTMQADGNLVVAAPGGRPLWAARTGGHSGSVLTLRTDGDAVLDAPGNVTLWSTDTSKQAYAATRLAAHAYGIPQADPGSKMAAEGSDWLTNPQTQIRWGEDYIQSRYGTPCQAWAYWQARRYYGPTLAVVPF